MTALWISLGVIVALLLAWRLRRASRVLDRILREERAVSEVAEAEQPEHEYRNR